MRKSETVLELERAYGMPIEQIIVAAYNRHGSVRGAADELGVSHNTLYSWMLRLRIEIGGKRAALASA